MMSPRARPTAPPRAAMIDENLTPFFERDIPFHWTGDMDAGEQWDGNHENLTAQVRWAISHDAEAKVIGARGRAFAREPVVLFADEPTGNLDTRTGERIIDLLFELNARASTTLVLVTHDERLAERCDRRFSMTAGELSGP